MPVKKKSVNVIAVDGEVEHPYHCTKCGEGCDQVTTVRTWDSYYWRTLNESWCATCVRKEGFECADCNDTFSNNHGGGVTYTNPSDERVCQNCHNNYNRCEDCGDLVHTEDGSWIDDDDYGEQFYCTSCASSAASKPRLRSYETRAERIFEFMGTDPDGLFLGVELETECTRDLSRRSAMEEIHERIGSFTIMKEDGSLDNGIEIVSAPASFEFHKTAWEPLFKRRIAGLSSWQSGNCGIHVHVSRSALTPLRIGKMLVFVNHPANENLIRSIAGRYNDTYCTVSPKSIEHGRESGYSRYEAINTSNDKTIEFRIFRGTLDRQHFYADLEFVYALCQWSKVASTSDLTTTAFLTWLEGNHEPYPNLVTFLASKNFPITKQETPTAQCA